MSHHDFRPAEVTKLAATVYDFEKDNPALLLAIAALGWSATEVPDSGVNGAWWAERGDMRVLITFGTVGLLPNLARAAFWTVAGGAGGRI
jgi:hypothetical protein